MLSPSRTVRSRADVEVSDFSRRVSDTFNNLFLVCADVFLTPFIRLYDWGLTGQRSEMNANISMLLTTIVKVVENSLQKLVAPLSDSMTGLRRASELRFLTVIVTLACKRADKELFSPSIALAC